jgi:hypothetical protein
MATSMASKRFNAQWFFSTAALQSIDAFLKPSRRHHRTAGKGGEKEASDFLRSEVNQGGCPKIYPRNPHEG